MSGIFYFIFAGVALLGWRIFARGRRGRRIDDHPVCVRCKFDLTGRPADSYKCPECGSNLHVRSAIEIGNRQRREGLFYTGMAIALLGAIPLMTLICLSMMSVDPIRLKPFWWLLRDAAEDTGYAQKQECNEIYFRVKNSKLSLDDDQKVVNVALKLQADLRKQWNPLWGDIIEAIQSQGKLSAADWKTYLAQDQPATFEVRPKVARGDPIPFRLAGEVRGATRLAKLRPSAINIIATVPGATTQFPSWGGSFGSNFYLSGFIPLTAASWDHLQPGTQSLQMTFLGVASATAANPTVFGPLNCHANWTLLQSGEKSVQLYHDEALAAQVQNSLSCEIRINYNITIGIKSDGPPIDLAFAVSIRSGSKEWNPSQWPTVIIEKNSHNFFGTDSIFSLAPELIGRRADIILRPSIVAAAERVDIDKLLDHEFIIKDVLIESTK
jgi:predicted RNA-binding Zn-ribbon protein involved in translation (DUF1610 family)